VIEDSVHAYWQKFLSTLPPDSLHHKKSYAQGGYGDSPELANQLIQLILMGKKTAICSSLWNGKQKRMIFVWMLMEMAIPFVSRKPPK
jgi:uncharacterized protein YhfF